MSDHILEVGVSGSSTGWDDSDTLGDITPSITVDGDAIERLLKTNDLATIDFRITERGDSTDFYSSSNTHMAGYVTDLIVNGISSTTSIVNWQGSDESTLGEAQWVFTGGDATNWVDSEELDITLVNDDFNMVKVDTDPFINAYHGYARGSGGGVHDMGDIFRPEATLEGSLSSYTIEVFMFDNIFPTLPKIAFSFAENTASDKDRLFALEIIGGPTFFVTDESSYSPINLYTTHAWSWPAGNLLGGIFTDGDYLAYKAYGTEAEYRSAKGISGGSSIRDADLVKDLVTK